MVLNRSTRIYCFIHLTIIVFLFVYFSATLNFARTESDISTKMPSENVVVNKVIVHPLVLLSVVDHFNRMGKIGNQKRVVGVLLGCWRQKGVLDVSNSFAGKCVFRAHTIFFSSLP